MRRRSLLLAPMALLEARDLKGFAKELAAVYGHDLPSITYIPVFACLGRLRLEPKALAEVEKLVEPYVFGPRDPLENFTPSHLSGHLLFASLYKKTRKLPYADKLLAAADRATLPVYNEMSDGFFMGLPLLAEAWALGGERKYGLALGEQLEGLTQLCRREDGLYRHSPLAPVAWGRGNGFVLLGLAMALEAMPKAGPTRDRFAEAFLALARTLLQFQTNNGYWRQVIDVDSAWEEYSATAMIATALRKGSKLGLLTEVDTRTAIREAFVAVDLKTKPDGVLLDVCESTGKMPGLDAYLSRKRSNGKDARGGAMALYFATELLLRSSI